MIVLVAMSVFAIHASAYAAWLIDDAGISIAYAKNLAHGFGLVAQPGAAPLEGYSNPTWVAILALLEHFGALALPIAPKIAGGLFVAATYATLLAIAHRVSPRPLLVGAIVLLCCSTNPSFVIWCTAGLENPLYVFAIALLAYATIRALDAPRFQGALAACGAAAALVAITRPDGAIFALVPIVMSLAIGRREPRAFAAYGIAFAVPFGAFLASRLVVFHHFAPNTYLVKGGVRMSTALEFGFVMPNGIAKLEEILDEAFAGIVTNMVLIGAIVAGRYVAKRGRFDRALACVVSFAFVALADFMLMPKDRMGEHRFATPFYPLYYLAVFSLFAVALDASPARRKSLSVAALGVSLVVASLPDFCGRALLFSERPSIGLFFVRRAFAERFDRYAETLDVKNGSILLPDVGGMLLWSHLRVVDLAGLCDGTIARTLFHDEDRIAARDYIFASARPTFIHADGVWAKAIALEEDPRFLADYAAIHTYSCSEDPTADGHVGGVFVRREVLSAAGGESALAPFRGESHRLQDFLPPANDSFFLRWLRRSPVVPEEYRREIYTELHGNPCTNPR